MPTVQIEVGDLVDGYRVVTRIGRGAMSHVFLARAAASGELAVLKVLALDPSDPAAVARFGREVELLGRVRHPGVVRVLGPVRPLPEGGVYFPLEFVKGSTLERLLGREGALEVAQVDRLGREIAAGLGAIHAQGIVHRDMKPSNVMIQGTGAAKILDFGLSIAGDVTRWTRTGMMVGTPLYMAPEQLAGSRDVDARSDLYALGVLVYEMLAGAHPFSVDTVPALILAERSRAWRPIWVVRPEIDPAWVPWLHRALAPLPEERFPSVASMLAAWPRGKA